MRFDSPSLDEYGHVAAIRQHASHRDGATGLRVVVVAPEEIPVLPAAGEVAAYRTGLEAMTDVTRHARTRTRRVELRAEDALCLEISDDGVGVLGTRQDRVGTRRSCGR
ncbi:MAG TPA: hypothetical protein VFB58_09220 [Chloroflexota bacterium]|nr:hypothetical protein [Chloroflexota bacterium]